ncbi:unnamed protein product [Lymnaea stagnalis]|uniref:non-specific protein-tyrosine kinase n=1 Tax=Lymnaea stagnalis TaxID=6523 RepID=A0AAV2II24_LYMST
MALDANNCIQILFVNKNIEPLKIDTSASESELTFQVVLIKCITHAGRKVCLHSDISAPKFLAAFGLTVCPDEKYWLPQNHVFEKSADKERNYKLKVRFHPSASGLDYTRNNDVLCEYLFLQILNDFLMGELGGSNKLDDKKLFKLLSTALLMPKVLPINSSVKVDNGFQQRRIHFWNLDKLFSKLISKRLITQRVIDHFWISHGLQENLSKMKQWEKTLGTHKQDFYRAITVAEPNYWFEQYEAVAIGRDNNQDSVTVTVGLYGDNQQPALYYGEVFKYSLTEIISMKLHKPENLAARTWRVFIVLKNEAPTTLQFDKEGAAESFMSMVQGFFTLFIRYDTYLSTDLHNIDTKIGTELWSFGPLENSTAENFLREPRLPGRQSNKRFLIHESAQQLGYFVVVTFTDGATPSFDRLEVEVTKDKRLILSTGSVYGNTGELRGHLRETYGSQEHPRNYPYTAEINTVFQVDDIEPYYPEPEQHSALNNDPGIYLSEDLQSKIPIQDKNPLIRKYDVSLKGQKMMLVELQSEDGRIAEAFRGGISVLFKLYRLKPANFLKFYGSVWEKKLCVLMEHAPCDLLTYICNHPQSVARKVMFMFQIVKILSIMEEHRIVHGNIRLRRFLVCQGENPDVPTIKLGDSGISSYLDTLPIDHKDNIERWPWLSPERREKLPAITYESECYATGTTLCEIIYRSDQFETLPGYCKDNPVIPKPDDICPDLKNEGQEVDANALVAEAKSLLSEIWDTIITKCWARDPQERPQSNELLALISDREVEAREIKVDTNIESFKQVVYDIFRDDEPVAGPKPQSLNDLNRILMEKSKHKFIPTNCLIISERRLGKGHYGEVWDGKVRRPNLTLQGGGNREWTRVAVKKFNKGVSTEASFIKEIMMACDLHHPNIVKMLYFSIDHWVNLFIGYAETKLSKFMLIMEYMNLGSLSEYAKASDSGQPPDQLLRICIDIAEGMVYLSGKDIVHRDIAARNILLQKQDTGRIVAKVSDFGLARNMDERYRFYKHKSQGVELPFIWTAPECLIDDLDKAVYTSKGDVWSFGMVVWETFSRGCHPAKKMPQNITPLVLITSYKEKWRLPKGNVPQPIYDIIMSCWNLDPGCRPAFVELVQSLRALERIIS